MRKFFSKIIRFISVSITLAVITATLALGAFMLPPVQKYMRNTAKDALEKSFGVPVSIGSLRYFPFKTIGLGDLEIHGRDSLKMIACKQATLNVGLETFWRKGIILSSLIIDSLDVDIHMVGDSCLNIEALQIKNDNDTIESPGLKVEIGSIELKRGRLKGIPVEQIREIDDFCFLIKDIDIAPEAMHMDISRMHFNDVTNGLKAQMQGDVRLDGDTLRIGFLNAGYGECDVAVKIAEIDISKKDPTGKIDITKAKIASNTLAHFVAGMPSDIVATVSCTAELDGVDFFAKNIEIDAGASSHASADVTIMSYNNRNATSVYVNCKNARTTMIDIAQFTGSELDMHLANAIGVAEYSGKIQGKISDMQLDGVLRSGIGTVKTDGHVNMKSNNDVYFTGNIASNDMNLNALTDGSIGTFAFNSGFDGQLAAREGSFAHAHGEASHITINGYAYENLVLDAMLGEHTANGVVRLSDENGIFTIVGELEHGDQAQLVVTARAEDFMTGRTKLTPDIDGKLNFALQANLEGNDIDDAHGEIWIDDLVFADSARIASSSNITINIETGDDNYKKIKLTSDKANGHAEGFFKYADLGNELYAQAFEHLGNMLQDKPQKISAPVKVDGHIDYTDVNQYLQFFSDDIALKENGNIDFSINSEKHSSKIAVEIGDMQSGSIRMTDLRGSITNDSTGCNASVTTADMVLPGFGDIGRVGINNRLWHNGLKTWFDWDNTGNKRSGGSLIAQTQFDKDRTIIELLPTSIFISDKEWQLNANTIELRDKYVGINGFRLENGEKFISLNGRASDTMSDTLYIGMNNITIENLLGRDPLERYSLGGDISADIKMMAPFGDPAADCDVKIDRFIVCDDNLDHLDLKTKWSAERKQIDIETSIVTNGHVVAHAVGGIDSQNGLDLPFDIDSLSTGFLNFYLGASVSDVRGTTSGKCRLYGALSDIKFEAQLAINSTDFNVKSTKVGYSYCGRDSVILTPNDMIFKHMKVCDRYGNVGYFGGNIAHDMFSNLKINIYFDVNGMLVMDLKPEDDMPYYGTIFADGRLDITGVTSNCDIKIKAQTRPQTVFSILPTSRGELQSNSYIKFKSSTDSDEENDAKSIAQTNYVTADIDVSIDPSAKIDVVLDQRTGNKLSVNGRGDLGLVVDKAGDLTMLGDYLIENGTYNFVLGIISKQFSIVDGSRLTWDGAPFNPMVDITAKYGLKASLYDLVQDAQNPELKKRVPVNCNMFLTNRLSDPTVKFGIEIPSSMNFNQYTIDQYISTEDEMNQQVFSLLLANKFAASESTTGTQSTTTGTSYIGTTVSELLSNQLSNWISQNKYNLGVGVNYRPGDDVTQEEYELALSTQVLNNKIILSGNIGYGRSTKEENEGTFIGDFDIEYKINAKGNLRAKAYTHSNNDVIYETSPTTQGIGISFREEFNSFSELIKRYREAIRRRREGRKNK